MRKKLNIKQFIEKAKKVHGDKYDYSKTKYVESLKKLKIICPEHGEFSQNPASHLRGNGCMKCSYKYKSSNTCAFVKKSKKIHGDKYDYSKVRYTNSHTKIYVICKIHGEFTPNPGDHLSGSGCPKCGYKTTSAKLLSNNLEFIKKSIKIHDNKYDYSKVKYSGILKRVCIICPKHGEFFQTPRCHLNKRGCEKCHQESRKLTTEEFIEKSKKIHHNLYDYSKVDYDGYYKKVNIICKKHGSFSQKPILHLSGCGCPTCKRSKGEIYVENYLKLKNISYIPQYEFFDCKGGKRFLPFDFVILNNDNMPNKVIEFQGRQHYEQVEKWDFESTKINDKIKFNYCNNNKIPLLLIPYWEMKNIEIILEKFLNSQPISQIHEDQ